VASDKIKDVGDHTTYFFYLHQAKAAITVKVTSSRFGIQAQRQKKSDGNFK